MPANHVQNVQRNVSLRYFCHINTLYQLKNLPLSNVMNENGDPLKTMVSICTILLTLRFYGLTTANIKSAVFWHVTSCRLVHKYQI